MIGIRDGEVFENGGNAPSLILSGHGCFSVEHRVSNGCAQQHDAEIGVGGDGLLRRDDGMMDSLADARLGCIDCFDRRDSAPQEIFVRHPVTRRDHADVSRFDCNNVEFARLDVGLCNSGLQRAFF